MGEGQLDSLLCSCNARSRKTLVGHAQWETIQPTLKGDNGTHAIEDQPGYPVKRKTSELGRINLIDDGRLIRAVTGNLDHSLEERHGKCERSRISHVYGRIHLPPMDAIPNTNNRMSWFSLTDNVFPEGAPESRTVC